MTISARLNTGEGLGDRLLKVNHAGEHGAVAIYTGQLLLARWTAPKMVAELKEFRSHEAGHRSLFLAALQARGVDRCRSYWLCWAGGLLLGLVTALLGRHAIAATTVAVEQVVLRHLNQQLDVLSTRDSNAAAVISQIVTEEQQHHDVAASHTVAGSNWLRVITPLVAGATSAVIWLGMHL